MYQDCTAGYVQQKGASKTRKMHKTSLKWRQAKLQQHAAESADAPAGCFRIMHTRNHAKALPQLTELRGPVSPPSPSSPLCCVGTAQGSRKRAPACGGGCAAAAGALDAIHALQHTSAPQQHSLPPSRSTTDRQIVHAQKKQESSNLPSCLLLSTHKAAEVLPHV